MSVFNSHSREQLRRSYAEAWAKRTAHAPLSPLEALITDVIASHPEYHALVLDPGAATAAFEVPGAGTTDNPFLHMGLHLAVREQVSVDRPPGIRELQRKLLASQGDPHQAEHALMAELAEALWQAQRTGQAPDEMQYLDRIRQGLTKSHRPNR